eukprot:g19334.t1
MASAASLSPTASPHPTFQFKANSLTIPGLHGQSEQSLSRGETHSTVQSGASKMSKLERLNSLGHLVVDKDMIYGLTLRKSLRSFGRAWMKMPQDMTEAELVALHSKAESMESFDFFVSHTWSTDGKWKVLSLLMQTGWPCALLFSAAAVVLTAALELADILPLPFTFRTKPLNGEAEDFPVCCWISCASFLGLFLGLLASPYFPCLNGRPGDCFIEPWHSDMVSIDQSDAEKIEDGIYGIGGFLSVSRELQVMWSPPYLKRLWCVFELAAYRKANPQGKITLSPLYVEQIVLMLILGLYAVLGTFWILYIWPVPSDFSLMANLLCMVPAFFPFHFMRRSLASSKHQLLHELLTFDLNQVQCMNDFDRSFIHSAIIKWSTEGRASAQYLLQSRLLQPSIRAASGLDPMHLGRKITLLDQGGDDPLSGQWITSYLIGSMLGFDLVWTYLCDKFASRCRFSCCDFLKTLLIWVLITAFQALGAFAQGRATRTNIWYAVAWFALVHHLEEVGAPRHRPDFEEAPQAKRLFAAAAWNKPGPRGKGRGKDGLVRASGRHYFEDRDDHADDATATWSQPTAANPYFGSLATEDTCACGSSNIGRHMCYDCGRQREAPSKSQVPPHSESFGGTGAKDGGGAGGRSRHRRVDAPPIDAPHIEGGSSGGASTGRRGATGSTKGDPKRGGYFNAEQEETFQDYKKHLRDEVLKSPPSERGVGAYIRSVTGELWGRVVCDQGRSWQLASGRSAKKENEGKIWNFEKPSNVAKANTALVPQTQRPGDVDETRRRVFAEGGLM